MQNVIKSTWLVKDGGVGSLVESNILQISINPSQGRSTAFENSLTYSKFLHFTTLQPRCNDRGLFQGIMSGFFGGRIRQLSLLFSLHIQGELIAVTFVVIFLV